MRALWQPSSVTRPSENAFPSLDARAPPSPGPPTASRASLSPPWAPARRLRASRRAAGPNRARRCRNRGERHVVRSPRQSDPGAQSERRRDLVGEEPPERPPRRPPHDLADEEPVRHSVVGLLRPGLHRGCWRSSARITGSHAHASSRESGVSTTGSPAWWERSQRTRRSPFPLGRELGPVPRDGCVEVELTPLRRACARRSPSRPSSWRRRPRPCLRPMGGRYVGRRSRPTGRPPAVRPGTRSRPRRAHHGARSCPANAAATASQPEAANPWGLSTGLPSRLSGRRPVIPWPEGAPTFGGCKQYPMGVEDRGVSRLGYVSSLDGVRGIGAAAVISAHYFGFVAGGFYSMDVFFALSGFLITTLLARRAR